LPNAGGISPFEANWYHVYLTAAFKVFTKILFDSVLKQKVVSPKAERQGRNGIFVEQMLTIKWSPCPIPKQQPSSKWDQRKEDTHKAVKTHSISLLRHSQNLAITLCAIMEGSKDVR
jgi:hypothetical protein